jgi:hypothetical protein
MKKNLKEKLNDYLEGLKQLNNSGSMPIGALIVDDKERESVVGTLVKGIEVSDVQAQPLSALESLPEAIENQTGIALSLGSEIPAPIYNQLSNLSNAHFNAVLPGQNENTVINPLPNKGFILLILSPESYRTMSLGGMVTSVCNLAI